MSPASPPSAHPYKLLTLPPRFVSPLTDVVYKQYARSAKIKPETVALGAGAHGHWLGNKDAANVLVWYHGTCPFFPFHLNRMADDTPDIKAAASACPPTWDTSSSCRAWWHRRTGRARTWPSSC